VAVIGFKIQSGESTAMMLMMGFLFQMASHNPEKQSQNL
jgi:hypothetical protein